MTRFFFAFVITSIITVIFYPLLMKDVEVSNDSDDSTNFHCICENARKLTKGFLENDISDLKEKELRLQVREKVKKSIDIIKVALENYSLDHISVSYNGGKDCLVMLVLLLSVLHSKFNEEISPDYRLDCIYVHTEEEFPEVTDFLQKSSKDYGLNLIEVTDNMKDGLQRYLDSKPNIQAMVVGIRRNDPHGENLRYIQITDNDWPKFMRIHPVLEWHYNEIWDFIRATKLDYCKLYDLGYTSLGGIDNTNRNPYLENGEGSYNPAYMLDDEQHERSGRYKPVSKVSKT